MDPRARIVQVCAVAVAVAGCAVSTLAGPLDGALRALMSRTDLGDAKVGVMVVDVNTGDVLAASGEHTPLIPASNMKLLTSGAALLTLGPDFAFETEVLATETDLVIRGSGDPAFGDPEILSSGDGPVSLEQLLATLASAVTERGVTEVDDLIIDDRVFDRELAHDTWPRDQLNRWYCAEIAGLNVQTNVLRVFVYPTPAAGSHRPEIEVEPHAGWLPVRNSARITKRGGNTVWIARPKPTNEFTLYGDVRHAIQEPIRVTMHDPAMVAGRLFADAVEHEGVVITGDIRRAEHEEMIDGTVLAVVRTHISDILRRCNIDSHNLYAEALIKRIGHEVAREPGSWSNGAAVMRMLLAERLGPADAAETKIADGSGMSRDNKVTASTLALWLRSMEREPAARDAFRASLPRPGQGTLETRFRDDPPEHLVLAKSGYLNYTYTLSGFVIDEKSSRTVAFSVLLNDVVGIPGHAAKGFHEDVVGLIDGWLTRQRQEEHAEALGG